MDNKERRGHTLNHALNQCIHTDHSSVIHRADAPRIHPRVRRTADTHPTCMTLRTTRRETRENVGGFGPLQRSSAPSPYAPISCLPPAYLSRVCAAYLAPESQPILHHCRMSRCTRIAGPAHTSGGAHAAGRALQTQGAGRRTRHRAHAPPESRCTPGESGVPGNYRNRFTWARCGPSRRLRRIWRQNGKERRMRACSSLGSDSGLSRWYQVAEIFDIVQAHRLHTGCDGRSFMLHCEREDALKQNVYPDKQNF